MSMSTSMDRGTCDNCGGPLDEGQSSGTCGDCDDSAQWTPHYSPWRHGGWYVTNVRYPSGACGCVSRNYDDRKWRIVCADFDSGSTYKSRDAAARAEYALAQLEAKA